MQLSNLKGEYKISYLLHLFKRAGSCRRRRQSKVPELSCTEIVKRGIMQVFRKQNLAPNI